MWFSLWLQSLSTWIFFQCPEDLDVEPSKLCAVRLLDAQKYFAVNLDAQTMFDLFTQGPIGTMSCHHWQISKSHLHRLAYRPCYHLQRPLPYSNLKHQVQNQIRQHRNKRLTILFLMVSFFLGFAHSHLLTPSLFYSRTPLRWKWPLSSTRNPTSTSQYGCSWGLDAIQRRSSIQSCGFPLPPGRDVSGQY